ncbi:MAG: hypothetical protein ACYCU7_15360 [Acidimicrobiales bacterium]
MSRVVLELTDERRRSLGLLVALLVDRHATWEPAAAAAEVREVEVLRSGRPGLLDVIAAVGRRTAHAVLGLRRPDEPHHHLVRAADEPVLGAFEDGDGPGVAVDAVLDGELVGLVLGTVTGTAVDGEPVALLRDDEEGVTVGFGERCTFTVFPWVGDGARPGVELLVALDDAGFNHLPAPIAVWRRGGRDLGLVQEPLAGPADGWALALTSLRDLYGSGGSPETAGGDFAPEARALGTMTARMHLALVRAYGRQDAWVSDWVSAVEARVRRHDSSLLDTEGVTETMGALESSYLQAPALRTHGDFHLGRTARTDQGWVVADCDPGGVAPGSSGPEPRSPLADVADMLWSLHHVAVASAAERDPGGRLGLGALSQAWAARNRRAFLGGYLGTPGVEALVPSDRDVVRRLAAVFELDHAARAAGGRAAGPV